MEKPTLIEFFRAMYTAHPFISYETVKELYEAAYKLAEVDPEIQIPQTKKTKKKK